jgi:hypothetical protein
MEKSRTLHLFDVKEEEKVFEQKHSKVR